MERIYCLLIGYIFGLFQSDKQSAGIQHMVRKITIINSITALKLFVEKRSEIGNRQVIDEVQLLIGDRITKDRLQNSKIPVE